MVLLSNKDTEMLCENVLFSSLYGPLMCCFKGNGYTTRGGKCDIVFASYLKIGLL